MKFLKNILKLLFILLFLSAGVFIYARYIEPELLAVKQEKMEIDSQITPCKVVFFTDTHFGELYPQEKAAEIADKIMKQEPDIVIFGGDFFDNYARDRDSLDLDYLKEQFSKIEAPYGKYAVFGNHDYGGGAARVYEEFMTDSGFMVLKNDSIYLEDLKLRIIGYDDYLLGKTDPSLYQIKSTDFNLIVTHEPDVVQFIEASGENLVLAGHSHGGQVSLPFITEKILPPGAKNFVKGWYNPSKVGINNKTLLYVSKGIGMTVIPFRFLNPPEIVVITLTSNDK